MRVRIPTRSAQPGQRRDEVDVVVPGQPERRGRAVSAASRMMPSSSRNHCTALPVARIGPSSAYRGRLAVELVGDRAQQRLLIGGRSLAGVRQQERAGAVGVLGLARARSRPARTVTPAGRRPQPRSARRRRGTPRGSVRAYTCALGRTSGSRLAGTPNRSSNSSSQSAVSRFSSSVRLAFVTSVTCVRPPVSRQINQESIVPNAISPRSARCRRPGNLVEQPADLGGGEVRVDDQSGLAPDQRLVVGQLAATGRGPPVLPDDGVVDRLAGAAVPQHRGLALVGDAQGGQVAGPDAGVARAAAQTGQDRLPDHLRVVLDPSGPGEMLGEFGVAAADAPRLGVEDADRRPGRALVDRQDVLAHRCARKSAGRAC